MTDHIALETHQVVKTYHSESGTINAVDHVDIAVHAGEFVALVGPSGSGKTTMLSILAALLKPTSGKILLDGIDQATLNEPERVKLRREKIGFTFQANNLVPFLTARENVELMLKLNNTLTNETKQRAEELLFRLGLQERMNNLPSQLSGGQQQRVAIARALIHNPSLVLADEPTGSLDEHNAELLEQLFLKYQREWNMGLIICTHDQAIYGVMENVYHVHDGMLSLEKGG